MTQRAGRVLALDLGRARIGVALSDPMGWTAQPLQVLERTGPRKDLAGIVAIAEQHEVRTILVGWPLRLSGEEGSAAQEAREFAGRVERRLPAVKVDLWDERLTTRQAERTMIAGGARRKRRRKSIDALAAALILQSYLDTRGEETARGDDREG